MSASHQWRQYIASVITSCADVVEQSDERSFVSMHWPQYCTQFEPFPSSLFPLSSPFHTLLVVPSLSILVRSLNPVRVSWGSAAVLGQPSHRDCTCYCNSNVVFLYFRSDFNLFFLFERCPEHWRPQRASNHWLTSTEAGLERAGKQMWSYLRRQRCSFFFWPILYFGDRRKVWRWSVIRRTASCNKLSLW